MQLGYRIDPVGRGWEPAQRLVLIERARCGFDLSDPLDGTIPVLAGTVFVGPPRVPHGSVAPERDNFAMGDQLGASELVGEDDRSNMTILGS